MTREPDWMGVVVKGIKMWWEEQVVILENRDIILLHTNTIP
jgi:hypothetical protein